MMWQDVVIGFANFIFTITLINQIIIGLRTKKSSIPKITSSFTALGLILMGVSFISLNLYYSGIIALSNAILWMFIWFQTARYDIKK